MAKTLTERWRELVREVNKDPRSEEQWMVLFDDAMVQSPQFESALRKVKGPQEIEDNVNSARAVLTRDYKNDVSSLVESIASAIDSGDVAAGDGDALIEYIDQTIDGTQRVIYTQEAKEGLILGTDNEDAYSDDFGEEGIVQGGSINWSALMYAAMRQDVYSAMERKGINLQDPQPRISESAKARRRRMRGEDNG